jgi:hypothetical protein
VRFLNAFKGLAQLDLGSQTNGQVRGPDEFSAPTGAARASRHARPNGLNEPYTGCATRS